MNIPAILLVVLLCAVLVGYRRRNAWRHAHGSWPLYAKKPLPRPEQVLYQRLVCALPGHIVLAGVEVVDVIGVKRGFDANTWTRCIHRLQYDFVVCSKDASVLAAISLEDAPRGGKSLSTSEQIKDRASAAAGVRLIRWQTKDLPDPVAIREEFGELQLPTFDEPASRPHPARRSNRW